MTAKTEIDPQRDRIWWDRGYWVVVLAGRGVGYSLRSLKGAFIFIRNERREWERWLCGGRGCNRCEPQGRG